MREDYLLYDGECPACSSYVAFSRLRRLRPSLKVLDARGEPALVEELRGRGYEINEGMVMQLAVLTSPAGQPAARSVKERRQVRGLQGCCPLLE